MSNVAAGELRHRILLQSRVNTQDPGTGENYVSWLDRKTVWAQVRFLSVNESIRAAAADSEAKGWVRIRYTPEIDATWRFVYRGQNFNIIGPIPDLNSGREYLTLSFSEGLSDGE
jgi:SPP1 family predicted phage head-tail adaptor